MKNISFPIFRMYSDKNTLFRINSENQFTEIKKTGKFYMINEIECELYPEKVFLNDLIAAENEHIIMISENEFNTIKTSWEISLTKF